MEAQRLNALEKIPFPSELANLGVELLDGGRLVIVEMDAFAERRLAALVVPIPPLLHLAGMHTVAGRDGANRARLPHRIPSHLRLERRLVRPPSTS